MEGACCQNRHRSHVFSDDDGDGGRDMSNDTSDDQLETKATSFSSNTERCNRREVRMQAKRSSISKMTGKRKQRHN